MSSKVDKYGKLVNREGVVESIVNMTTIVPNFIQQWNEINTSYENFCWKDNISDNERIKEYIKINALYKKFISGHKNNILDLITEPEKLLNMLSDWIKNNTKKPENGWTRYNIVYIDLRNKWMFNLANYVAELIEIDKRFTNKED